MRIFNTVHALWLMIGSIKTFYPRKIFKDKRVAVIGAADSALEEENGDWIDGFDIILRVNKAPHFLTETRFPFIGSRTDVLFHSFYENTKSGGGPIDFNLYKKQGVKYVVNPNNNLKGLRTHFAYYKRNVNNNRTYILSSKYTNQITKNFKSWKPTIGFSALYTALNSECLEVYITGFTFFQTPYADKYRDHLKDLDINNKFIQGQGIHNPVLELEEFIRQINKSNVSKIGMDNTLRDIIGKYKSHNKGDEKK